MAPIEQRVADLESKVHNFTSAHPAIGEIVNLLGRYFPNEVSVIKELL